MCQIRREPDLEKLALKGVRDIQEKVLTRARNFVLHGILY